LEIDSKMSEETDKTRLQTIIAQNRKIMDSLSDINAWIIRINDILESLNLKPMIEDEDETEKEGELFGVPIETYEEEFKNIPIPTDGITEKGLPKPRIISSQIVGTLKERPANRYSVTFLKDETEKAIEVIINRKQGWLPKSCIFGTYPNALGEIKKVFIATWIVEKNFPEVKE
jgi:hypothetical protein